MSRQKNVLLTYQILYVSQQDLSQAAFFAQHLLDKALHFEPWEARWQSYLHQGAYMTAMVVAYGRPFTESRGYPRFPAKLLQNLTPEEKDLHSSLLSLRNKIYAHTDLIERKVRPIFFNDKPSAIEALPPMRMSASELKSVRLPISKISHSINAKLHELVPEVREET
ncbi:hypothetical protein [Jeongeupia sp. USM3]|uniref:hypothetical protein n=1 Tax=Jeongeupia sp. USM3 TaxID=1906741 RepID=UPI0011AB89B2|nr:hypothetical protein [Jeongeupia sp. USM3]